MSDPRDETPGIPPDEKRHYGAHVERAVAGCVRALALANDMHRDGTIAPGRLQAELGAASVDAMLAIADRLDVLIGCLFDEGRAVTVREADHG